MNRWTPPILATVLSCVPIALNHATDPALLTDTDTSVLLKAIRARHDPLSWFAGDWPLQNHFYRPVPTLAFEWDNHFYGKNASGYGWTNDILCILCVLLLLWLARELTDRPVLAGLAAVLFSCWHWASFGMISSWIGFASWAVLAIGIWRHRRDFASYVPVFFAIPFFANELLPTASLQNVMIAWLPSRTASVMTVFALISMAAYVRYERVSAQRRPETEPTPLTPPATKSAIQSAKSSPRSPWIWMVVAAVAEALALASYEQAVMLAPALCGVAFSLWLMGYRPRWGWQGLFFGILAGYLLLRHQLVPSAPSHYQLQQFRHGPGVFLSLSGYILPVVGGIPSLISTWDPNLGIVFFFTSSVLLSFLFGLGETVGTILILRRRWVLAFTGWALSWGTFFPMAWLKQFGHYDYWPMAMRSFFVVALGWAVWDGVAIALRPRVVQAPPRPVPAPGSLPHL